MCSPIYQQGRTPLGVNLALPSIMRRGRMSALEHGEYRTEKKLPKRMDGEQI